MKTFVATAENRQRDWYVVDAEGHAFSSYAASPGDSFLIRPDGHLDRVTRCAAAGS